MAKGKQNISPADKKLTKKDKEQAEFAAVVKHIQREQKKGTGEKMLNEVTDLAMLLPVGRGVKGAKGAIGASKAVRAALKSKKVAGFIRKAKRVKRAVTGVTKKELAEESKAARIAQNRAKDLSVFKAQGKKAQAKASREFRKNLDIVNGKRAGDIKKAERALEVISDDMEATRKIRNVAEFRSKFTPKIAGRMTRVNQLREAKTAAARKRLAKAGKEAGKLAAAAAAGAGATKAAMIAKKKKKEDK